MASSSPTFTTTLPPSHPATAAGSSSTTTGQPSDDQKRDPAVQGSTGQLTASGQPRKRKKAARACNHCQTAHLTCDDNRPCNRCVKRNLGDTCQDGVRKKAKYLRDIEDEVVNKGKLHPTHFTQSTPAKTAKETSPSQNGSGKENASKPKSQSPNLQSSGNSKRKTSDASLKPTASSGDATMVAAASVNNSINQDHDDQNLDPSLTALSQASVEFARQEDSQPHRLSQQQHQNSFDDEFLAPTNPDIHRQTVALQHHDASGTAAHLSQPVQDTNASNTASGNDSIYQFFPDFSNTGDFGSHSTNLEYAVLSSMLQNSGYNSSNNNHSNNTGSASMNGNGLFNTTSPNNSSNNNMALSPANMGLINSPLNLFPSIQTGYGDGSNLNNSDTPTSTTSSTGWPSNVMPSNGNASSSSVGGTNKSNHDANDAPRPSLTNSLSHGGVSGFSQSFGFPPAAFSSSDTKTSMGQHRKTSTSAGNSTQSNRNGGMPSPSYTPGPHHSQQQHQPSLSPYHSSSLSLPGNHSGNSNNARNGGFTGNPIDHDWPQISSTRPTPAHLNQDGMSYAQQQQLMLQQHNLSTASKPVYSSTGVLKVEDVYRTVNKPYNYLEAYHALIRYLQANFSNKSDILRIIRAIAIYRPSLIALQMPLTLEDEIFVERSFQRTLIELEKLISFSGTPTLVWRRTGEIMLVGTEFLLLSEWKKNDLLSQNNCFFQSNKNAKELKGLKRKYVFEIFDQQSVVEYYESFAAHAFESSSSTIMSTCNIVTPKGRKVPCTFAYNLKRDIFGLPSMVIGQFLPILNNSSNNK